MHVNTNFAIYCLGFAIASLFSSYSLVIVVRRWATGRMLDLPNSRSSHSQPTPRGGGLAIILCTLVGLWLSFSFFDPKLPVQIFCGFGLGAILIGIASWLDDLSSVPIRVRFAAHAAGAVLLLLAGGFWRHVELPFFHAIPLGWLGPPLTLLWITGSTNAYNFMDGIDGLAGGQAVIGGLTWTGLGLLIGEPVVTLLGILVASSSLGFLGHNWPPARIFMGDVGSAFLGFTFAAFPVITNLANPRLALAGVLVIWPFAFDTIFTLMRRLRRGENAFAAHRSHLYQRLIIAGQSHREVTLVYLSLALVGSLLTFAWVLDFSGNDWAVLGLPCLLSVGLWRFVVRVEMKSLFLLQSSSTTTTTGPPG